MSWGRVRVSAGEWSGQCESRVCGRAVVDVRDCSNTTKSIIVV